MTRETFEGGLHRLKDYVGKMGGRAGEALSRAVQAVAKDDLVDELRNRVLHDLLDVMVQDPQTISRALELLIVARHLERAADHITNICERVVYMATGELRERNV